MNITKALEDEKLAKELRNTFQERDLDNAHDLLVKNIVSLIEARIEEADAAGTSKMYNQLNGYTMALQDLYYQLYGNQLDTGQDIEPTEPGEVPF